MRYDRRMASKPPLDVSDFEEPGRETRWANPTIVVPAPDADTQLLDPAELQTRVQSMPRAVPVLPDHAIQPLDDDPEGPSRVSSPSYGDWLLTREQARKEWFDLLKLVVVVIAATFMVVWLTIAYVVGSY